MKKLKPIRCGALAYYCIEDVRAWAKEKIYLIHGCECYEKCSLSELYNELLELAKE